MSRPAILAAFAHPDDETFAIGGTLARARAAGLRTALWCATDGEGGSDNRVRRPPDELARIRRLELVRALGVLGVDRLFAAGFPDGGLGEVPDERLEASLAAAVRAVRPAAIVTFGPEGAPNAHRDHQRVSTLATRAFAGLAAATPELRRLWHVSWSPPTPGDGRSPVLSAAPPTCRVDVAPWLETKRRAFEAHATQRHHRAEFEAELREVEEYTLAAGTPQSAPLADDLLTGL